MSQILHLVRHGALDASASGRFVGQTDLALSALGEQQAERLAVWFADKPLAAVLCSDLTRARQTAQAIATRHALTPRIYPELREIALGSWENRTRAEVAASEPENYAARGQDLLGFRPPGGESFADCLARTLPLWDSLLSNEAGTILVVAHAGVNRLLLSHALGLPLPLLMALPQDYGCLNTLRTTNGLSLALEINFVPH